MIKRFTWILTLILFISSCAAPSRASQDEQIAETLVALANEQLASTPSKVPPTKTPTEIPTLTPSPTFTPTLTPTPEPTSTPDFLENYPAEGYGPINFPSDINPLTGIRVSDATKLNRRPISVKISNYPRGIRPQWGLTQAEHVFEYYHEGGLTRFNAIFYSNDVTQIGPIRSARFSDKDLVEMYKAFFAYGSADWRVRARLSYSNFTDRMASITDFPCPPTAQYPLCRIDQDTWNHLVTRTEELYQHFENKGVDKDRQNLDGLLFKAESPSGGQAANSVLVRYSFGSYHKWIYDPISGKYFRHQDIIDADVDSEAFEPTIDRLNDQPISAANVVILLAQHRYYSVNPEMIEIPFDGFGSAYVFRNGLAYLVNWGRLADSDIIFLAYDDGTRFPLKPGNTWFVVIGSKSEVQGESPDWRFQFLTP